MEPIKLHTFHIPVMGLGFTIDTPIKVARFGISSVVSIIEDGLVEEMRKFHSEKWEENFRPIEKNNIDYRALRITAYLNLLSKIVKKQIGKLKEENFENGNEIVKYFEMLPDDSEAKKKYLLMKEKEEGLEKHTLQIKLREFITAGSIDVNIMTKCDRMNYSNDGTVLPQEYADAMAALRGFALSEISSSVIFSAGLNPRLFSYCELFNDFFPDYLGKIKKKIILKVSDFRSAIIQGKFFAKKGLWISEFRIESGLNCGGHAFATEGYLLGPILQEFSDKRNELENELFGICNEALIKKRKIIFAQPPHLRITVQGGIGTAKENNFLLNYYALDGTGWGSPFLLVPEATNVDDNTLKKLETPKKEEFFLSKASPLGIPFHNFRKTSSEYQRKERIEKGRPGSPCYKKFLAYNTEFTKEPICTASREFQNLKINQLKEKNLPPEIFETELNDIVSKECLCEGLGASARLKNHIKEKHNLNAVALCPGPNLAYFSGVFSLSDMVGHIYGRKNILNSLNRPNMFINELELYLNYLKNEIRKASGRISEKQNKYFSGYKINLMDGIEYYKKLIPNMTGEFKSDRDFFLNALKKFDKIIRNISIPMPLIA